jgi:type I restriction enzyme S subunit
MPKNTTKIPEGWKIQNISDVCNVLIGGTPSRNKPEFWDTQKESNNVWVSIRDLGVAGKYISDSAEYISEEGVRRSNVKLLPKDTVLMSFKLTIGRMAITKTKLYTNEAIAGFAIKNKNELDANYLYNILPTLAYEVDTAVKGKTLNKEKLLNTRIVLPPLPEQNKIAEILGTVDEEIEKTEKIIEETVRLKSGLMKDLFTKGIGHAKFKKTKLGMTPDDWQVVSIKDAPIELVDGDRGVNYPKSFDFTFGGYCLFLSNKNVKDDQFIFSDLQFISKDKDEALGKGRLQRLDVVLTTRGTVGNVAFYNDDVTFENIRINSGMLILRAVGELSPKYLYHLMKSPLLKKKYIDVTSGSAQPQLPIKSLGQIFIPIPPEDEQEKIVEACESIDKKFLIYKEIRNNLTKLKKGLLEDLLSGRVRAR